MAFPLYDAVIPQYLQTLRALAKVLDKGEAFAAEKGIDPQELVEAKLIDDMWPLKRQVRGAVNHSSGAIEGLQRGTYGPDATEPPADFAAMKADVAGAITKLEGWNAQEIDALLGGEMAFVAGQFRMEFTPLNYVLHFAQPSFYFHATTAYDILRHKGVQIGKADFLGGYPKKG